jgi:hypothetical protein
MRFPSSAVGVLLLFSAMLGSLRTLAQNQPPGSTHVIIPNPTPRPPDLKQELEDDSKEQKQQKALSLQGQLRAREIWLESNQILLLAQQLQQEINSGKKNPAPMSEDAAKVAQIEKLARSVQEKMVSQILQPDPASPSATPASSEESQQGRIEADTKKLYQLALELRTEVAKTYKQNLSLAVLKKAGELEKLGKNLKSEMNHEASANQ